MNINPLEPIRGKISIIPASDYKDASDAINTFAIANNFTYSTSDAQISEDCKATGRSTPAWLGMTGFFTGKQINHVIKGSVRGFPVSMFLMTERLTNGLSYQEGSSKQQKEQYYRQQTCGVVRVRLPKQFPQIVLDSYKNDTWQGSVWVSYRNDQLLQLESDFSDYFDLYSPRGLQLNTLVLLAPNMMQLLKNSSACFDVEFYGDELILFTRDLLYDPAVMAILDEALQMQLTYLERLLPSWNYQPVNLPFDTLRQGGTRGSTIRIGKRKIQVLSLVIILYASVIILILVLRHAKAAK